MNLNFFNLDSLKEELEALPPLHRVAFAASICERMLPIYQAFSQQECWGNSAVLTEALDEIWQILQGKRVNPERIEEYIKACKQQTLHADYVVHSRLDYEAQQTVSAVCYALKSCLEPTSPNIAKVNLCVEETIYGFLTSRKFDADASWTEKLSAELDEYVVNHPLAVQEIVKQEQDLHRLKEVATLNQDFLEWLRTSSYNDGKSLIDLS